jgi:hypothetical protein
MSKAAWRKTLGGARPRPRRLASLLNRVTTAVLLFRRGAEDTVLPEQAREMFVALTASGRPPTA